MRRIALLIAVILTASACAFSGQFLTDEEQAALTPQSRAFQLQGEFNILLDAANTYAAQPFCTATLITGCADPDIVVRISEVAEASRPAIDAAQVAARSGAGNSTALSAAARVGVAQLSALLITEGIIGGVQ